MPTCLDDPNALTMDELDRLYRRVVHNIRGAFPELLAGTFAVSQLYQQIVPYRTNRRELAFDSNEEYELALMQLLAGLRGYVTGDRELQHAMRNELASPNPDLAAFRLFAASTVALAPEALRALERRSSGSQGSATSAARLSAGELASLAGRATESVDLRHERPRSDTAPMEFEPPARPSALEQPNIASLAEPRRQTPQLALSQTPPHVATPRQPAPHQPHQPHRPHQPHQPPHQPAHGSAAPPSGTTGGTNGGTTNGTAPRSAPPRPSVPSAPSAPLRRDAAMPAREAPMAVPRANPAPVAAGATCRYCSGALPDGRRVTFCPCCGHNLKVQHCPACATELEVEWKFCITCGRGIEGADVRRE